MYLVRSPGLLVVFFRTLQYGGLGKEIGMRFVIFWWRTSWVNVFVFDVPQVCGGDSISKVVSVFLRFTGNTGSISSSFLSTLSPSCGRWELLSRLFYKLYL